VRNIPELGDFTIPVMLFFGLIGFGTPLVIASTWLMLWLHGDAPVDPKNATRATGKR
jgi:hypothetical protein